MVRNHGILVAQACRYGEASRVISIEFADWVDTEEHLLRCFSQWRGGLDNQGQAGAGC
jgi:hypothetical protein